MPKTIREAIDDIEDIVDDAPTDPLPGPVTWAGVVFSLGDAETNLGLILEQGGLTERIQQFARKAIEGIQSAQREVRWAREELGED